MQIISHKNFAAAALNLIKEVFVIYIVFLDLGSKISIYPAWAAQIALLVTEKVVI